MLIFSFLKTLKLILVHINMHILLTCATRATHTLINTHTHTHAHTIRMHTLLECQHIPHTHSKTHTHTNTITHANSRHTVGTHSSVYV